MAGWVDRLSGRGDRVLYIDGHNCRMAEIFELCRPYPSVLRNNRRGFSAYDIFVVTRPVRQ